MFAQMRITTYAKNPSLKILRHLESKQINLLPHSQQLNSGIYQECITFHKVETTEKIFSGQENLVQFHLACVVSRYYSKLVHPNSF